jgi:hypothetical protein
MCPAKPGQNAPVERFELRTPVALCAQGWLVAKPGQNAAVERFELPRSGELHSQGRPDAHHHSSRNPGQTASTSGKRLATAS